MLVFQLKPLEKGCLVLGDGAYPHGSRGCDAVETRVATRVLDEHAGQAGVSGSVVNSLQCFQIGTLKTDLGADAAIRVILGLTFWRGLEKRANERVSRLACNFSCTHSQIASNECVKTKRRIVSYAHRTILLHGSCVNIHRKLALPDGFEPSYELLESSVLPLNYGSIKNVQCANTLNVSVRIVKPLCGRDLEDQSTDQNPEDKGNEIVNLILPEIDEEWLQVWGDKCCHGFDLCEI